MPPPDSPDPSLVVVYAALFALLAILPCAAVWMAMAGRWDRRLPVLPYQPRRPVPWGAIDVMLLVSVFIITPPLVGQAAHRWFDLPMGDNATKNAKADQTHGAHPLARLLLESRDRWATLLGICVAVVVAPISEELVFRLVLQGWLESLERRMRRRIPALRRIMAGVLPVTTVALLFAAVHFRESESGRDLPNLIVSLGVACVASLVAVTFSVCWLRFAAGATLSDFGIVPSKLAGDIRLGLLAFLAITLPVYIVMFAAKTLLPENVVADPIPLALLAAALGVLYYRTHRIVPAVVLHSAFNAVSVIMALAVTK
jgi:membrane protease YdiL (CAAX protease family)